MSSTPPFLPILEIHKIFLGVHDFDQIPAGFLVGQFLAQGVEYVKGIQAVYALGGQVAFTVKGPQDVTGAGIVGGDDAVFPRNRILDVV
jgi:hypothetical protein